MNLTLAQINSLVTTYNGGRNDYSTSELSLFANMALDELCNRVAMQSLDSLTVSSSTSGDSYLTRPASCNYVTSVSNLSLAPGSGRTLSPVTPEWIDSNATQVGIPVKYAEYRNQILLWPSADSTYSFQIRFQEKVPPLLTSSQTPAIDTRYHDAVAFRAAALAAAARNDLDQESVNQARYLGFIGATPSDQAYRQKDKQIGLHPAWQTRR